MTEASPRLTWSWLAVTSQRYSPESFWVTACMVSVAPSILARPAYVPARPQTSGQTDRADHVHVFLRSPSDALRTSLTIEFVVKVHKGHGLPCPLPLNSWVLIFLCPELTGEHSVWNRRKLIFQYKTLRLHCFSFKEK